MIVAELADASFIILRPVCQEGGKNALAKHQRLTPQFFGGKHFLMPSKLGHG